jgi:hypothetical protein
MWSYPARSKASRRSPWVLLGSRSLPVTDVKTTFQGFGAAVAGRACSMLTAQLGSSMILHPALDLGFSFSLTPCPVTRTTVAWTSSVPASKSSADQRTASASSSTHARHDRPTAQRGLPRPGVRRHDPVTGKRHDLVEVVPAGPKAAAEAEKVRTRLLNQLDERRNPRTKATVNQLLNRYLEVVDLDDSTRKTYVGYLDRHVRPVLGNLLLSKVDGEMLDFGRSR